MNEQTPPTLRAEQLHSDQRIRWRRGERVLVESYLRRYPSLQSDTECLLQLINNEVVLREELEGHASPQEYLERFPHLHAQIEELFEVHRALESESLATVRGEEAPQPAAGWPVVEGYEILAELGRGGMGVVYRARQTTLGREVALKVPRPGVLLSGEFRERFVREARAAALLDHPNLVPVYEVGSVGPLCFIASAYCPGITLTHWLAHRSESVPVRLSARLVATLAEAVQHAHERGVIHRDLKPSNVLLQFRPRPPAAGDNSRPGPPEDGFSFVPRITDFGLAKLTVDVPGQAGDEGGIGTQSGAVLGTPNYMAPEQAGGKNREIGPAADIHALGAILYELLTGRPPFLGETVLDTLEQVRNREPLPPHRLRPRLPRDPETICLKCLEKDPRKRYDSARALAEDLHRYLAGAPILARPTSLLERGVKWTRRKPTQALLAAVSALATLVILAVVLGYNAALADSNSKLKDSNNQLQETNTSLEASNTQLQLSIAELKRQRDEARENTRQAIETTDELFTSYQNTWLNGSVFTNARMGISLGVLPSERELLEKHLSVCGKLLEKYGEDPAMFREMSRTYDHIGQIYFLLRNFPKADDAFQKSLSLERPLAISPSDRPRHLIDLARTYFDMYHNYQAMGAMDRAEATVKKIVEIKEQLVRDYSYNTDYRRELVVACRELRYCYTKSDRQKEGLEIDIKIARLWEKLVHDNPARADFVLEQAQSYSFVASNRTLGLRDAFEWRTKAIRALERLCAKDPINYRAINDLRNALGLRAWTLEYLGQHQQALADLDRAIDLDARTGMRDIYRMTKARFTARAGGYAKAVEEAQEITSNEWANSATLFGAAQVYVHCNSAVKRDSKRPETERRKMADQYAARAVECLKKAKAAGYPNFIETIRKDKDLGSLQGRQDYQEFLRSLQPAVQPKATP